MIRNVHSVFVPLSNPTVDLKIVCYFNGQDKKGKIYHLEWG